METNPKVAPNGALNVKLVVNGKQRVVPAGTTLRTLVEDMGAVPSRVVVEHNLEIVSEDNLESVEVADGDKVEVIQFVGGG